MKCSCRAFVTFAGISEGHFRVDDDGEASEMQSLVTLNRCFQRLHLFFMKLLLAT